jgi:prolipoprotein diacylglyceryl transferase
VTTTYLAYIPSPPQGVWHLWVIPVRAYALFIIVGIIVALILGDRRWVARGGQPGVIYDIALSAVPFGLIGGRLYHVMTDWRTYFSDDGAGLAGALRIWDGGLGIWGAVALGGVGAWIGCRQKGIPLPAFGDAIAPGIVLAQAIGRLGNYFNQELYGRPTTLPWGLEVYERRDASGALDSLNGVSTGQLVGIFHPTFLYELLWNVLIFAALIYIDRRFKIGHGRLFAMYVAGYCFGRFWIELMRSDVATHIAGIRVNSFTSTFVFIGAVVYIMVAPKGREDPASLAGKPEVEEEDEVEAFAKELTAVAATTGVVAAAKAAGEAEDEDAKVAVKDSVEDSVEDEAAEEPEGPEAAPEVHEAAVEAADDAEAVDEFAAEPAAGADEEPEADSEDAPAAGLGAVEGEEATEALEAAPEVHEAAVEAADEAEAVADEVAAGDEAAEAEEPEAEAEEAPEAETEGDHEPEVEAPEADSAEPEAGLGSVEGEEAAEAVAAAPEVHEAAVEAADEAEAVADEVAARDEAAEAEEAVPEAEEAPEAEEPEAGLGSVEGEEAAEAVAAAPEVHEAAVEATDEAETVADEVASEDEEPAASEAAAEAEELAADVAEAPSEDIEAAEEFAEAGEEAEPAEAAAESEDSEPDEPDTEDAEAAVGEAEAESSEEKAAEEAEAVAEEADSAAEDEPKTGVLEEAKVDEPEPTPEPATARKTGGRLSRWLRRTR